jgi:hypothetical protein
MLKKFCLSVLVAAVLSPTPVLADALTQGYPVKGYSMDHPCNWIGVNAWWTATEQNEPREGRDQLEYEPNQLSLIRNAESIYLPSHCPLIPERIAEFKAKIDASIQAGIAREARMHQQKLKDANDDLALEREHIQRQKERAARAEVVERIQRKTSIEAAKAQQAAEHRRQKHLLALPGETDAEYSQRVIAAQQAALREAQRKRRTVQTDCSFSPGRTSCSTEY